VNECEAKRMVSCGDAGHCVDSIRLGDFEVVHAADVGAAGAD
jgi:hypothetical protein